MSQELVEAWVLHENPGMVMSPFPRKLEGMSHDEKVV